MRRKGYRLPLRPQQRGAKMQADGPEAPELSATISIIVLQISAVQEVLATTLARPVTLVAFLALATTARNRTIGMHPQLRSRAIITNRAVVTLITRTAATTHTIRQVINRVVGIISMASNKAIIKADNRTHNKVRIGMPTPSSRPLTTKLTPSHGINSRSGNSQP